MRYSKLSSKRAVWLVALLVVVLSSSIVAITQIAGAKPNPAGNNGTIKVDGLAFDDDPNNEPHVTCPFQVDFYGYDEGDLNAEVTFEAQEPTTRPGKDTDQTLLKDTVFIGEDDNSGGGSEAGLDASKEYALDFTGITPQDNQGFHVSLTIDAEGSQGADVKHKVYWVTPCEASTTTTTTIVEETTTTTGGGEETTTTAGGGEETTTTGGGVGEETTTTAPPEETTTTAPPEETTTTAPPEETTTTAPPEETTTTAGGGGEETTTTAGGGGEETTTTTGGAVGGETTTTAAAGGILPTTSGQGLSAEQVSASQNGLPRTGANALPMVIAGLLLVLVGAGGLFASRRLRAR
jgi:LPXTG-motif cell wall-anchored protein